MHHAVHRQRLHHVRREAGEQLPFLLRAVGVGVGAEQAEPVDEACLRVGIRGDEEVGLFEATAVGAQFGLVVAAEPRLGVEGERGVRLLGHLGGGRVHMLDLLVGRDHLERLVVQVDRVDVDAVVGAGGGTPHRRVEGQHGLEEVERGVLEGVDGQLVREAVQPQQEVAEVARDTGREGHAGSLPARAPHAHPMFR
ncbi:hypothetical protein D9M68_814540 [compost metagenome]